MNQGHQNGTGGGNQTPAGDRQAPVNGSAENIREFQSPRASGRDIGHSAGVAAIEFSFEDQVVRTVVKDGESWFVAADVCTVLEHRNSRDAISRLDDDEMGVAGVYTPGGQQQVNVVNESGLYHLILTSRKPRAKAFRRWVTNEVLPAIRQTGRYESRRAAIDGAATPLVARPPIGPASLATAIRRPQADPIRIRRSQNDARRFRADRHGGGNGTG